MCHAVVETKCVGEEKFITQCTQQIITTHFQATPTETITPQLSRQQSRVLQKNAERQLEQFFCGGASYQVGSQSCFSLIQYA